MNIENMNVRDSVNFEKFKELKKEAIEAEEVIRKAYASSFGPKEKEKVVYAVSEYGEYYGTATLSADGIWHYQDDWCEGRDWYIKCTVQGIFELFRDEYLFETKQPALTKREFDETPARYFRKFIEETKTKLN